MDFEVDKNFLVGRIDRILCGSNSAVECNLAKVEVAGSNPVSRSNFQITRFGEGDCQNFRPD